MKKLLNYFFQGLLVVVPIAVTIFVIYKIITWIDNLLPFQIPVKLPGIGEVSIPGLGILTIVVAVTAFGYLAKFFVANPFFVLLERMLERTPLLKIIYTSVKDLIEAFVGEKNDLTSLYWLRLIRCREYSALVSSHKKIYRCLASAVIKWQFIFLSPMALTDSW